MPFRQRVKRAFGRSDSQSDSLSLQKTISSRKDSSVYQPGEEMPRPKYRGSVDPKHKAKLEKFTFTENWRRKSTGTSSLYSPMGSRLPSRNNSINTPHRAYLRGGSYFGKVNEDADETDDVANVGGTRNHSVDYTSTNNDLDVTKDSPEHQEFSNGILNVPSDAYQPLSEADLSNALEKIRTRTNMH